MAKPRGLVVFMLSSPASSVFAFFLLVVGVAPPRQGVSSPDPPFPSTASGISSARWKHNLGQMQPTPAD